MNIIDVAEQIRFLQELGGDTWNIEAKSAAQGYPETVDETLSSFANMPEGGLLLLGVSELDGIVEVTGVQKPTELMATLGSKARTRITPPVRLGAVEQHTIEGREIVACVIPPQDPALRPFRVGKNGPAFIRSGDGDYELSEPEVAVMLAQREAPRFDVRPVEGADVTRDLDPDLLEQYLNRQKQQAPRLRAIDRSELLIRTSVMDAQSGFPTVAAVYALGVHPQQFLPTLSVKARVLPAERENPDVRLRNQRDFAGPVPDLLESTLEWIVSNMGTSVIFDPRSGHGRDAFELPLVALREVVANALVHRDLSPSSLSSYINVVKRPGELRVTNPGGLWGLTTRQLGATPPSARNPVLYEMCRSITTNDGNRVVEAAASGIPAVRLALQEAHLPEPRFRDSVIRFEVELSSVSLFSAEELAWLASSPQLGQLTVGQRLALVSMRRGEEVTNASFRAEFPTMDSVEARRQLQELVQYGLAKAVGQRGGTVYVHPESSHGNRSEEQPGLFDQSRPRRLSSQEKAQMILDALVTAAVPLPKAELQAETGLSDGQMTPTLAALRRRGLVEFTEPERSPNQRYRLVEKHSGHTG